MNDFRERKMAERARRIAERIHAAGGVQNMAFVPLDAVAAPGGKWEVPEPSKATLEHMASFGFSRAPDDLPPRARPAIEGDTAPANEDR